MEQTTERPATVPEGETPAGPFAKGAKKVERIAQESKGLFDDVKDWIDLKIKFTWLEVQAEVAARKKDAVVGVMVGVLGVLGIVFALLTVALGLGAWLGHPAWGFLIVTGVLFLVAGLLYGVHFSRREKTAGAPDEAAPQKQLAAQDEQKKLPPGATPPVRA